MLELRDVGKTFFAGSANAVRALDGIGLSVADGDFVTVIGSNGAGKSTLLRAISGEAGPVSGEIRLDGRDLGDEPVHRRAALIGRVSQDPQNSVCASMSIAENLAMAARRGKRRLLHRAVTAARRSAFREALGQVGLGLEERLDARVGLLSGGQRQAVALLMAVIATPRLLLLDEHLASLDPRTAAAVMGCTARLVAAHRLTTLMVTHDMEGAIRWGNRLVMMHAGRIVFAAEGDAKAALTVARLVARFHQASGAALADDRVLLAGLAAGGRTQED